MEHYSDRDRPQKLAEIEIVNRNCVGLILPQICNSDVHNVSNPGTSRHLVYEDCVPQVMALVESEPELVAQAKQVFDKKLKTLLVKEALVQPTDDLAKVDFEKPELKTFMSGLTLSVESVFNDIHQRDIRPLASCKIIKSGIIPTLKADPLAQFRVKEPLIDAQTLADAILLVQRAAKETAPQPSSQQTGNQQTRR